MSHQRPTRRNKETQPTVPMPRLFDTRREWLIALLFIFIIPCIVFLVYFNFYPRRRNPSATILGLHEEEFFFVLALICPLGYTFFFITIKTIPCHLLANGCVKRRLTYKDILREDPHLVLPPTNRHFSNPVLAYISPGNSRGYELAKNFTSKFTHMSPIWYELNSFGNKFILEGRHNADIVWISELRKKGKNIKVKVLPKFNIEAPPVVLLKDKKQRDKAISLIIDECRRMTYDGVVLDFWPWASHDILRDIVMREKAIEFIRELGKSLHNPSVDGKDKRCLDLIYIIHPPRASSSSHDDHFGHTEMTSLGEVVDGFSLVLYGFSSADYPGPNAPLRWIYATLDELLQVDDKNLARKTFLGLSFNGHDYLLAKGGGEHGVKALTGNDYKSTVEQHCPRMGWDESIGEHYFIYLDNDLCTHTVFYPSLLSIWIRLVEAQEWGVGIAIHQLGEGLDYSLGLL